MYSGKRYRDAGRKSLEDEARANGTKPFSLDGLGDDAIRSAIPLLPVLGSYVPPGYQIVSAGTEFEVGSIGSYIYVREHGTPRSGELSPSQFAYLVRRNRGYGYAFPQIRTGVRVIGVYRPTSLREIARTTREAA